MKFMHVGASMQSTRTEKTVSKSFPFSCSEPPTALCKSNESKMCEFRSLSLLTFDEIREPFRDVSDVILLIQREKIRRIFEASAKIQLSIAHILVLCLHRKWHGF